MAIFKTVQKGQVYVGLCHSGISRRCIAQRGKKHRAFFSQTPAIQWRKHPAIDFTSAFRLCGKHGEETTSQRFKKSEKPFAQGRLTGLPVLDFLSQTL